MDLVFIDRDAKEATEEYDYTDMTWGVFKADVVSLYNIERDEMPGQVRELRGNSIHFFLNEPQTQARPMVAKKTGFPMAWKIMENL